MAAIKKTFFSVFAIVYICALLLWLYPQSWAESASGWIGMSFLYLGLDQTYKVFSPPPAANTHLIAAITYENGFTKLHAFPRLVRLSRLESIPEDRWRKLLEDNLEWTRFRIFWPDLARWTARNNAIADNPVDNIILYRFLGNIPPIYASEDTIVHRDLPQTTINVLFSYAVRPEDLK